MVTEKLPAASGLLLVFTAVAAGSYPKAQNVTWKSTDFKTFLTWEPKPSAKFSYTVQFSRVNEDQQRNSNCIRTSATMCDLTMSLTELKSNYVADVLSVPPLGVPSDLIEFPHSSSPPFCPYKDTDISRPDFKLEVSQDKKTTTLFVSDPLTALFKDGRQLNIRDVFSDELQYKVTYRRNKSTGKKVHISKSNVIELSDLDREQSYCFNVQAFIPSRRTKQLGELSQTKCTSNPHTSLTEEYPVGVIVSAIVLILLLIGIIVAVVVVCCKRRRKDREGGKEGLHGRDV